MVHRLDGLDERAGKIKEEFGTLEYAERRPEFLGL